MASGVRAGRAFVEVYADNSKLAKDLRAARATLQGFADGANRVGMGMAATGAAMALPAALAVRQFAAFDDQMRLVRAVTQATEKDFAALTDTARNLGATTSWTAAQVAEGMVSLGRMGFKPDEINAAIGPMMDLARATGTDVATASDIAGNALRTFKLRATDMSDVADVMTATANGSAQTLVDLGEAFKMAAPQASAMGETVRDVAAALGIMANMGIRGTLAGTALRRSYTQFADPKVIEILSRYNIKTIDTAGNVRKLKDVMVDIAKVMASMPSGEKVPFVESVFDLRGSLAGYSLGGNIDQLNAFMKTLENVGGVAKRTAETMDKGMGGTFRIVMSAVESLAFSFSKNLEPAIQSVGKSAIEMITQFDNFIKKNPEISTAAALIVAGITAIGASLLVIGFGAKVLAVLTTGALALKAAWGALALSSISSGMADLAIKIGVTNSALAITLATLTNIAAVLGTAIAAGALGYWLSSKQDDINGKKEFSLWAGADKPGGIRRAMDWAFTPTGMSGEQSAQWAAGGAGKSSVSDDDLMKYYVKNVAGKRGDRWGGDYTRYIRDYRRKKLENPNVPEWRRPQTPAPEAAPVAPAPIQYDQQGALNKAQGSWYEMMQKMADARADSAFMKELNKLLEKNLAGGLKKASDELKNLEDASTKVYGEFMNAAYAASLDGQVSDEEQTALDKIKQRYEELQQRIDAINNAVDSAKKESKSNRGGFGSYSGFEIAANRTNYNEQLEIAKRSERHLSDIKNNTKNAPTARYV